MLVEFIELRRHEEVVAERDTESAKQVSTKKKSRQKSNDHAVRSGITAGEE